MPGSRQCGCAALPRKCFVKEPASKIRIMRKLLLISLFALFCAMGAGARDAIYLRDGSVVRGTILDETSQTVRLEMSDGSRYVFRLEEIESIVRDEDGRNYNQGRYDRAYGNDGRPVMRIGEPRYAETDYCGYLRSGFRGLVDIGFHYGFGDARDNYMFSAALTCGYQAGRSVFIGAGLQPSVNVFDRGRVYDHYWGGYYSSDTESNFVMPFYGALRFDFVDCPVSPFLDLRGGYYITNNSDVHGGFAYAGLGCRFNRFSVSGGYAYYGGRMVGDLSYGGVKLGFEF